ncbi:MAG: hypothetical protein IJY05_03220 [Clostridia bacterium]|nr:hypothetical protein [Clostridia bacterium]
MGATKNVKTKTNNQKYLDEWMNANPDMKNFVSGTQNAGGAVNAVLPEGASREEQDLAQVYQTAYNNAVAIDKRAQNAILEANKAHDLSMKYLAAQNEANGLGGLGIADTSSIRLSSQYQKALTDAYATKEASLLENYQKMTEDASTIRGEWASREEAEADEKYAKTETAILNTDDEDTVKAYLNAAGYEEGTEDYTSLLNDWRLASGYKMSYDENGNVVINESDTTDDSFVSYENDLVISNYGNGLRSQVGDNFQVYNKENKKVYYMEVGRRVNTDEINKAASDIKTLPYIFKYNGELYVKTKDGSIYEAKGLTGNNYDKLVNSLPVD